MDKYYWYLGRGKYLEDKEAYEHVESLNIKNIELREYIINQLNGIMEYLAEYEINKETDFSSMFENVMELNEKCSSTAILLKYLSEQIEERIEDDQRV